MNPNRIQVDLESSDGAKQSISFSFPNKTVTIVDLVAPLQLICDAVVLIEQKTHPISCHEGCAHCCNQLIPLSAAEAAFLSKTIDDFPRAQRRGIRQKLISIQKKIKNIIATSNDNSKALEQRYFGLNVSCPFLENNRCSIYSQRPLVCREYHVDNPSEDCRDPYGKDINRVNKGLNLGSMLTAFCAHLLNISKMPIPLSLLDDWLKDHPNINNSFDAKTIFTQLMTGVVKVAKANAVISTFHWQFVDDEYAQPSNLLQLLIQGKASSDRGKIHTYLQQGINLEQGQILTPTDKAKLFVQHANAENLGKVIGRLRGLDARLEEKNLFIEIGAGDGYFRYLSNLNSSDIALKFGQKIIETERDLNIVNNNRQRGKHTILLRGQDLTIQFGDDFTPLVISFNVLDVLISDELDSVLVAASAVLMPEGRLVHIMSSSIHPAVFIDIANTHTTDILLPYQENGFIGVVLVDRARVLDNNLKQFEQKPMLLAALFGQSPDDYVAMADQVQNWLAKDKVDFKSILLHEYSLQRISIALQKQGFVVECNEVLESNVLVTPNEYHRDLGRINTISNRLGALIANKNKKIATGKVKESSTFGVVIAKKMNPLTA